MYTDEEIEEAVGKIVRTSIRRQFGSLGNRRTDLTFNDTKDAAAGVFILFPNALFYVVFLAAQRLLSDIEVTRKAVSDLAVAITAADRKVTPVDTITPLANAREGLQALQAAVQARLTAFQKLESVPAYQRFEKNAKRFLDEIGARIKAGGGVVLTPQEARAKLTKLYTELDTSFTELKRKATFLGTAVEDFERLNLPGLLSNNVIGNAQRVLGERFEELEALTPEQRLLILRGVVLDVLAARSSVKGFGKLNTPTTFLELSGTGSVYADEEYPLTPATILAENAGPYGILPSLSDGSNGSEHLEITVDGDGPVTVYLLGSYVASIDGGKKGPFAPGNPNGSGVMANKFSVGVKNYPEYGDDVLFNIEFNTGTSQISAWDVCYHANNDIGAFARPITFKPYSNPLKLVKTFDITRINNADISIATNPLVDMTTLGIKLNDHMLVRSPGSAYDGLQFKVTVVDPGFLRLAIQSFITHVTDLPDETGVLFEACDGALAVRVTISGSVIGGSDTWDIRHESLYKHQKIYFPKDTQGDETLQQATLNELGFIPVMESSSQATPVRDLVKQFNATSSTSLNGVARMEATYDFLPVIYEGTARTDPNDPTRLVCSRLYEKSKALTIVSGNDVTFATLLAEEAEVHVNDKVVIRSHDDPDTIGVMGTVTNVTSLLIEATMDSPVTAGTVDFESGPILGAQYSQGATVFISGGSLNDGEYSVLERGTVPFELQLFQPFPIPNGRGNQPINFQASVGHFRAIFKSLSTGLNSSIRYDYYSLGSAVGQFTPEDSQSAIGTSNYFQLPEIPNGIEEDDVLELYDTQFNLPTFSASIRSFDLEKRVIELSLPLPVNTPSYSFTLDTPVPFARVRKKRRANYDQLRREIAAWMTRFDSQERYFSEISRALNGVVSNKNPTIIQTGDAKARVVALDNNLNQLVAAINNYLADVVPEVDVLIKAFKEKGADRAVGLLLEARVNEFFALTQEEASYAGNLQKAIRDVQKNDLPVKKTGRDGASRAASSTLASYDEVDFEYDQSDIDSVGEPDTPGYQGPAQPGNAY